MLRIKDLATTEERHQNPQEAIGDASQRTAVTVATAAQRGVIRATRGIFLHTDARPVVPAFRRRVLHAYRIETVRRRPLCFVTGAIPITARMAWYARSTSGCDASASILAATRVPIPGMERTMATSVCSRWSPGAGSSVLEGIQEPHQRAFRLPPLARDQRTRGSSSLTMRGHGVRRPPGGVDGRLSAGPAHLRALRRRNVVRRAGPVRRVEG